VELVRLPERVMTNATASAAVHRREFRILVAPLDIPTVLPPIDVRAPVTREADFDGVGVPGAIVAAFSPAAVGTGDAYTDGEVDRKASLLPGQMGPAYPDSLRSDALDGLVIVRFVVDTAGQVESPSLHFVGATHALFAEAVRSALDRLRFSPAELAGHRVRVRLEQRFEFHLAGAPRG